MSMVHYNQGRIKRNLPIEKLFISEEGIENFIRGLFKGESNLDEVVSNFMKEIRSNNNIDCRGIFANSFRVSHLCEQLGFDCFELCKHEYFWLLYDSNEVDYSSIII